MMGPSSIVSAFTVLICYAIANLAALGLSKARKVKRARVIPLARPPSSEILVKK